MLRPSFARAECSPIRDLNGAGVPAPFSFGAPSKPLIKPSLQPLPCSDHRIPEPRASAAPPATTRSTTPPSSGLEFNHTHTGFNSVSPPFPIGRLTGALSNGKQYAFYLTGSGTMHTTDVGVLRARAG
jgi:hypothetical protein